MRHLGEAAKSGFRASQTAKAPPGHRVQSLPIGDLAAYELAILAVRIVQVGSKSQFKKDCGCADARKWVSDPRVVPDGGGCAFWLRAGQPCGVRSGLWF